MSYIPGNSYSSGSRSTTTTYYDSTRGNPGNNRTTTVTTTYTDRDGNKTTETHTTGKQNTQARDRLSNHPSNFKSSDVSKFKIKIY